MLVEWEKESHNPYSRSDSGSGMQRKRQTPTPRNALMQRVNQRNVKMKVKAKGTWKGKERH